MTKKTEKITAYAALAILLVSLLPVLYLGRYNHPTGDDYYYGVETHRILHGTGSIVRMVREAGRGVAYDYNTWQGTYSALFLMRMPPNAFSEKAYAYVTAVIVLLLAGGIFILLKPLITEILGGSRALWLLVSSVLSILCIQTVPTQGETLFWYNGSMYYTGYLGLTFMFFGLLVRYVRRQRAGSLIGMLVLAPFLAGGNYVSLLPAVILTVCVTAYLFLKKHPARTGIAFVCFLMLAGLAVSMLAPGNAVRQSDMWKIPAWKAVAKSLVQGVRYFLYWIRGWQVLAAAVLTPFLLAAIKKAKKRFPYPLLVIGFTYGVFCSMSCPTFYTMNSTGPARAVAIVYYSFQLTALFMYVYLLGYLERVLRERRGAENMSTGEDGVVSMASPDDSVCTEKADAKPDAAKAGTRKGIPAVCAICVLLAVFQIATGKAAELTAVKAVNLLASGEAAAYEEEYLARMDILKDKSVSEAVLPAFVHQPDMLYVGDLSGDADEPTNVKVAEYFGKKSVRVSEE